ncbi:MAG: (2Fe-2S)-binding protein [Candidatus Neomarinimicrobiota bacterium]|nr:MAG: (2Fe-2S)-binding protein [Candidatus Neomarinimicrobiota bacterium]
MKIEFTLNNEFKSINVDPAQRLLDLLREDFGLTSVKEGCGEGECGACIVLMDGRAVNSCLIPAGNIIGKSIVTLEGFRKTARYKMIEKCFLDAGSVQCGFCTPGFVMATESLLNENPHPTDEEIKAGLSGNLCRCTGYNMIIDGVKLAAKRGNGLW